MARSRAMVVDGPCPQWTTVASSIGTITDRSESSIAVHRPARQVGAADRAGEQDVPAEQRRLVRAEQVEHDRAGAVAGRVAHAEVETAEGHLLAVGEFADVVRLGEGERAEQRRADRHPDAGPRVGELRTVGRVDERRHVASLAHRQHREGVVEVSVREQDGDRVQPVLGDDLVELSGDSDARVDDDALLAATGSDDPAVGGGRVRRETRDEHGATLSRSDDAGRWTGHSQPIEPAPIATSQARPRALSYTPGDRPSPGATRPLSYADREEPVRADEQAAP